MLKKFLIMLNNYFLFTSVYYNWKKNDIVALFYLTNLLLIIKLTDNYELYSDSNSAEEISWSIYFVIWWGLLKQIYFVITLESFMAHHKTVHLYSANISAEYTYDNSIRIPYYVQNAIRVLTRFLHNGTPQHSPIPTYYYVVFI